MPVWSAHEKNWPRRLNGGLVRMGCHKCFSKFIDPGIEVPVKKMWRRVVSE